ncbi:hypothetical protein SBRCBS47491_010239 [Sporothrix bragantina]|uniref:Uncharacterized protein n=1 Tax=Sporothrix bragantina TaxID=671064 RepID=A0ABP0D3K3_9PEZI
MATPPATPGSLPRPRLNSNFRFGNGSPPSPELNVEDLHKDIDEFQRLILAIQSKAQVLQAVRDVLDSNAKLQAASEVNLGHIASAVAAKNDLQTLCEGKDATIAQLQASEKQLLQKVASIQQLEGSLSKAQTSVESLGKAVQDLEKQNKILLGRLDAAFTDKAGIRESYRITKNKLDLLEGYALPPRMMMPEKVSQKLDVIFRSAFDIINKCFSQDLDNKYLGSHEWNEFKNKLKPNVGGIPLAPSNSPDAKRMRTAAVLRSLALAASDDIFQPEYTLQRGSELSSAMNNGIDDPDHANFVRRQLLQIEADDVYDTIISVRMAAVKKSVGTLVQPILAADVYSRLSDDLGRWLKDTVRVWREDIQPLPHGIIVYTDPEVNKPPAREWAVMAVSQEWTSFLPKNPVNGRASNASGAATAASAEPTGNAATTVPTLTPANDVVACIWPVFVMIDKDKTIARKGLALTNAQVAEAKKEEVKLAQNPPNSHRVSRVRTNSVLILPTSRNRPFQMALH